MAAAAAAAASARGALRQQSGRITENTLRPQRGEQQRTEAPDNQPACPVAKHSHCVRVLACVSVRECVNK